MGVTHKRQGFENENSNNHTVYKELKSFGSEEGWRNARWLVNYYEWQKQTFCEADKPFSAFGVRSNTLCSNSLSYINIRPRNYKQFSNVSMVIINLDAKRTAATRTCACLRNPLPRKCFRKFSCQGKDKPAQIKVKKLIHLLQKRALTDE